MENQLRPGPFGLGRLLDRPFRWLSFCNLYTLQVPAALICAAGNPDFSMWNTCEVPVAYHFQVQRIQQAGFIRRVGFGVHGVNSLGGGRETSGARRSVEEDGCGNYAGHWIDSADARDL